MILLFFGVALKKYVSKFGYLRINSDILFVRIGYIFVYLRINTDIS
jgi:hypothetical protein